VDTFWSRLTSLREKETVTGIMEYTQGVSKASSAPPKAVRKIQSNERFTTPLSFDATEKSWLV